MIRPAVIGLPRKVGGLKNYVRPALITHNENDIPLPPFEQARQFSQINPAKPIIGNRKTGGGFPLRIAEPVGTNCWLGLRTSLARPKFLYESPACPAIKAHPINLDRELRFRICAYENVQRFSRLDTRVRTIAFNPGTAVFCF